MTREESYDSKINPLMAQIIAICQEHGIAMLCSFYLGDDIACTSALLDDKLEPPQCFLDALERIRPRSGSGVVITTRDKAITTSITKV